MKSKILKIKNFVIWHSLRWDRKAKCKAPAALWELYGWNEDIGCAARLPLELHGTSHQATAEATSVWPATHCNRTATGLIAPGALQQDGLTGTGCSHTAPNCNRIASQDCIHNCIQDCRAAMGCKLISHWWLKLHIACTGCMLVTDSVEEHLMGAIGDIKLLLALKWAN